MVRSGWNREKLVWLGGYYRTYCSGLPLRGACKYSKLSADSRKRLLLQFYQQHSQLLCLVLPVTMIHQADRGQRDSPCDTA